MSRVHGSWTVRWFGSMAGALVLVACFDGTSSTRGLPCTSDASCDGSTCSYGVCGGPIRCAAGASVGDYCFALEDTPIAVGAGPTSLTIGDVDHDLRRDIVSVDGEGRSLSIRLGHADGTFSAPTFDRVELGFVPTAVGIGSLDGRGWADLAITAEDGSVHVVLLDESGAIDTTDVAEPVAGARAPIISDFVDDEDGLADVAVLGDDGIRVARRTGDVAFDPAWIETHISDPSDILTLRDAAGVPTVAYVALASNDEVSTYGLDAEGKFSASSGIGVGPDPQRFVLVDINGDAYVDIVSANARGELWRTLGKSATPTEGGEQSDPTDRWSHPERIYDLGWTPSALVADNLDDDDDAELVIAGATPDGHQDVYLFDNDGDGNLIYGGALGLRDAAAVVLSDVDRDSVPEILIAARDGDAIRLARRTVAPPPVDGTGSATDTGKPASEGAADTFAEGPGTDSATVGVTTFPGETGVDTSPPCDYSNVVGSAVYADCDLFVVDGAIAGMAFTDYTGDGLSDLVVLSHPNDALLTIFAGEFSGETIDYSNPTLESLAGAARIWGSTYPVGVASTLLYTDGAGIYGIDNYLANRTTFTIDAGGSPFNGIAGIADLPPSGFDAPVGTQLAILGIDGVYLAPAFDPFTASDAVMVEAGPMMWPNAFIPASIAVPSMVGELPVDGSLVASNPDGSEVVRLVPGASTQWEPFQLVGELTQPGPVFAGWTGGSAEVAYVVTVGTSGGTSIVDANGATRLTIAGVYPAAAVTGNFDGDQGDDLLILDAATTQFGIVADVLGPSPAFVYVEGYAGILDLHAQQLNDYAAEIWLALPERIVRLQNY